MGLHAGYGAAQRLYISRGYVPDGRGVTWRGAHVMEGAPVMVDDELVVWMTRRLARVSDIPMPAASSAALRGR